MAKKQTRRSISVSRDTYERLKSYCETQGISMSQFVETRVGDFLGSSAEPMSKTTQVPRPVMKKPEAPKEVAKPAVTGKIPADQIFTF